MVTKKEKIMWTFDLMTILVVLVAFLASSVKILREYERGVVFRLGRIIGAKGPGLIILIPGIDKMVKVDLRTVTLDVPPQDIITRDNVSVKVSAVVYFRVLDAIKAIVDVADFHFATSQLAQTTLRSVCADRGSLIICLPNGMKSMTVSRQSLIRIPSLGESR